MTERKLQIKFKNLHALFLITTEKGNSIYLMFYQTSATHSYHDIRLRA